MTTRNIHPNLSRIPPYVARIKGLSGNWNTPGGRTEVQFVVVDSEKAKRMAPDVKQQIIVGTPGEKSGGARIEMNVGDSAKRNIVEEELTRISLRIGGNYLWFVIWQAQLLAASCVLAFNFDATDFATGFVGWALRGGSAGDKTVHAAAREGSNERCKKNETGEEASVVHSEVSATVS